MASAFSSYPVLVFAHIVHAEFHVALKGHFTCVVSGGTGSECACVVGLLCVLVMQTLLCVLSMALVCVGL